MHLKRDVNHNETMEKEGIFHSEAMGVTLSFLIPLKYREPFS